MATVLANLKYMSNTYSCPGVFFKKKKNTRAQGGESRWNSGRFSRPQPPSPQPAMGREATELDAEQQQQQQQLLLRRCRRLFTAEDRSFRMDRRSQAAAALRAAVADVLPRFLGSYTDDTLEVRASPSIPPPSLVPRASRRACCCQTCAVRCGRRRLSREVGFGGAASIVGGFSWVDNERAVDLFQCSVSVSSETVKVANSKLKLWSIWVPLYVEWKVGSEDFRANLCFDKG